MYYVCMYVGVGPRLLPEIDELVSSLKGVEDDDGGGFFHCCPHSPRSSTVRHFILWAKLVNNMSISQTRIIYYTRYELVYILL